MKNRINYVKSTLNNGVRLITISGLPTNAITISAFLRAGFRFDPPDKPGLSHFTEHMVFSGTKSYPTYREEAEAVEQYGGWHIAYTWIEEQKHIVHISQDHFQQGMEILLESIFVPLIKKEEVEKEKGVIKEEILKEKSDPATAIWNYVWFPLFFQETILSRPYYGSIEDVAMISRKDIQNFIESNFITQETTLLIAGDMEVSHSKRLIEDKLSSLLKNQQKNLTLPLTLIEPMKNKRVLIHDDPTYHKTSILVGVETVPFKSHEKYAINILREMIGGYFGTHLLMKLRDAGGLIYTWETFHDSISDTGYLVFHVSTAHESVYKVARIILDEFERLSNGKFTEKELELARGHLTGSMLANIEKGQEYIELYGMQELLNPNNVLSLEEQIDIYKNIDYEQVKSIAAKYLRKENVLIGILGRADEIQVNKLIR